MTADHYAAASRGWATGTALVYGPIAAELIALSPHPLADHTCSTPEPAPGRPAGPWPPSAPRPIATDLSFGMLAWDAAAHPAGGPSGRYNH